MPQPQRFVSNQKQLLRTVIATVFEEGPPTGLEFVARAIKRLPPMWFWHSAKATPLSRLKRKGAAFP